MHIRLRNTGLNTITNEVKHFQSINLAKKHMRTIDLKDKRALWSLPPKISAGSLPNIDPSFILKRARKE